MALVTEVGVRHRPTENHQQLYPAATAVLSVLQDLPVTVTMGDSARTLPLPVPTKALIWHLVILWLGALSTLDHLQAILKQSELSELYLQTGTSKTCTEDHQTRRLRIRARTDLILQAIIRYLVVHLVNSSTMKTCITTKGCLNMVPTVTGAMEEDNPL